MSSQRIVLQLLRQPKTYKQLLDESGLSAHNLHTALYRLRDSGLLVSVPEVFHRADQFTTAPIDNPVTCATIAAFPNN